MRFWFVHAADLHLDTPFEGIRRVAPFVADALRDASLQAFDALVSLAIARDAAFVVLAGGWYDGPRQGIRAQLALRRGLERLSRAGIVTLIARGPHDPPEDGWTAIGTWPERVRFLGEAGVAVERGGETLATVYGDGTAEGGNGLAVGVLHADIEDAGELRGRGMDYWALGGRRTPHVLADGDPWVVYPGTHQTRGTRPEHAGARGAFVVEVDGRSVAPPEFVALDRIRSAVVEADVTGLGQVNEVAAVLNEQAQAEAAAADRRSLLLRGRLVGAGPVVAPLRRPGVLAELLTELRDPPGDPRAFTWWDTLEDATRMPVDLEALRRRGDFGAALLDTADTDGAELRALVQRQLASANLAGAGDEIAPERLRHAVDLALDTLVLDIT